MILVLKEVRDLELYCALLRSNAIDDGLGYLVISLRILTIRLLAHFNLDSIFFRVEDELLIAFEVWHQPQCLSEFPDIIFNERSKCEFDL